MINFSTLKGFKKFTMVYSFLFFFNLSWNNLVMLSLACFFTLIKLLSIFGRRMKKKFQHTKSLFDPPKLLCPLRVRGVDRPMV